uniref:Uncharacterized protein n=1 Tax=Syphacia muris TaxID=451379 RepID=A0A0N5AUX4_9BILA
MRWKRKRLEERHLAKQLSSRFKGKKACNLRVLKAARRNKFLRSFGEEKRRLNRVENGEIDSRLVFGLSFNSKLCNCK